MTTADDIFEQSANNIQNLGLREIPFTESPTDLQNKTLDRIFTGREKELRQVFNLFQNRERRRILIYGRIGIGKTAFLLEILSVLTRKRPKMLTTYISLPPELDLATTALIALAKALPDDDWAQRQLHQMGIPTAKEIKERTSEAGTNAVFVGKFSEKDVAGTKAQYPTVSLEILLDRALEKYPDGVLIAIDDLDKQNPRRVRELMHDAQGILKGKAWFMLTGHPLGITGDLLTSERGLFDLQLKLEELDQPTTYKMLINYLNSARINNNCDDVNDPRSVLPFLPETAKEFCRVSLGKPRFFNRLGNAVLSTAANLGVTHITPEVLQQGFKTIEKDRKLLLAEKVMENRIFQLLQKRGSLSDETITIEELELLGVKSYSEIVPYLERLDDEDFVQRSPQLDAIAYTPILLPSSDP
jgi:hypothetical protein